MSDQRPSSSPAFLSHVNITLICGGISWWLWDQAHGHHLMLLGAGFAAFLASVNALKALAAGFIALDDFRRYVRAIRQDSTRGSAGWLSAKDARALKLHRLWQWTWWGLH